MLALARPELVEKPLLRNYLRARGEYALDYLHGLLRTELPPRTRRILVLHAGSEKIHGTTSAHAENTGCEQQTRRVQRNYLRARGEY